MKVRSITAILLAIVISIPTAMTAFAATTVKDYTQIKSLKFTLKSEGFDNYGYPELSGETSSKLYTVDSVVRYTTTLDEDWGDDYSEEEWSYEDWWPEDYDPDSWEAEQAAKSEAHQALLDSKIIPDNYYMYDRETHPMTSEIYVIKLTCDDDNYKFEKVDSTRIKANVGIKVSSFSIEDSGATITVKFTVTDENAFIGQLDESTFVNNDGVVSWGKAQFADRYNISINLKNTAPVKFYTESTSYDLRGILTTPGTYTLRITALDSKGAEIKNNYVEKTITVTDEMVQRYKQAYANYPTGWFKVTITVDEDTVNENGDTVTNKVQKNVWKYRKADGLLAQGEWISIINAENTTSWYYIDSDGYLATKKWIHCLGKQYYVSENGKMLVNTTTPDGYKVDANGARV